MADDNEDQGERDSGRVVSKMTTAGSNAA